MSRNVWIASALISLAAAGCSNGGGSDPNGSASATGIGTTAASSATIPKLLTDADLLALTQAYATNPQPAPTTKSIPQRPPRARRPARSTAVRSKALAAPESTPDAVGISFDQLEFEIPEGAEFVPESLPETVRKLLNKKVRIRGYIWPDVPYEKGNKQFILVRDDKSSGAFVTDPELCENIVVRMQEGKTVDFTVRPVTVEGVLTFRAEGFLPDDPPTSVLHISADSAEPPPVKK